MNRGQILGQVFILILASVVFIMILIYGYKAISQFSNRSEQIALIDFQNNLANAVKAISLDFGSVKRVDLTVPTRYQQLCVFCTPETPNCNPSAAFEQAHPLLTESWRGGSQNVFLVPLADSPILLDHVEAQDGAFCTNTIQGKVSLRLEGKGDHAYVAPWQ